MGSDWRNYSEGSKWDVLLSTYIFFFPAYLGEYFQERKETDLVDALLIV
jgi:hypothetical protein